MSANAVAANQERDIRETGDGWGRVWKVLCGVLIAAVVACLGSDAIFDRNFSKNITDGVAYLDISRAIGAHHPEALLNAYWSPGYPVALHIGLALLHPVPKFELAAVYIIHWAIGLAALCGLIYLVTGLPARDGSGGRGLTRPVLLAAACALFLIAIQADAPVYQMTPDLLLAVWLWVAGGAFLRITRQQRMPQYALLAAAVSLAYFTKAAALALVLTALLILPFAGSDRKKARWGTLVYLGIVAALIGPYIGALSAAKGRFTFGDSGSLNYAWIVDAGDSPDRWHMQPDSPHGHARLNLAHPAHRLMKSPDVFEYASPVQGSFPIFDDPSYWDEGLKPVFYLRGEIWHVAMNVYHTLSWLGRRGEFVIALLALLWVQAHSRVAPRVREILPALLWFASLWGVYLLVDVEDRYVFAVLTAMLLIVAASIRLPDTGNVRTVVTVCALILVSGAAVRSLDVAGEQTYRGIKQFFIGGPVRLAAVGPYQNPYWEVAQTLRQRLGVRENDRVACMQLGCDNAYWAELAGVRVVADVSRQADYWAASPEVRAKVMAVLAGAGVKVLVAHDLGTGAESEGWVPLNNTYEASGQQWYGRLTK